MFRKKFTTAKLAVTTMGSGGSKKTGVTKPTKDVRPDSSASLASSDQQSKKTSRSLSSASSVSAMSQKSEPVTPATTDTASKTQTEQKLSHSGNGEKELVVNGKMKALMRGKKVSDWQQMDIDKLMKLLNMDDGEKSWYDIIDEFASREEPVVEPLTKRKGWRTVRLFISSTFKDMHSEREHLVKKIIPVLRQWCQERKLNLIECDLRWGIPKDADTHETLLTCLSEIDRCREENEQAFFLSMLSERYGFVMAPEEVPSDIKARYKWLPGMSITSLEIMTGAYWDKNPNALFMMRKSNFLQHVDENTKPAYAESQPDYIHSLSVLKEKIKKRFPEHVVEYDCTVEGREGNRMMLGDLDHFGKVVLEHFKTRIAAQYPNISEDEELTDTEIKRAEQEEFMLQRSEVLLGRESEVKMVDDYINSDAKTTGLLTLVGYPGAGKSSIMAFTARHHMQNKSLKVFFHFVGVSPDSTSAFSVLSRIYRECMPADQQDSMPLDNDDMMRFTRTMFQEAATQAKREGFSRLVIFIDALNQLDDKGNTHKLTWLPRQLPEGVRVVVSTLEGTCLDSLRNHANPPQEVKVNPLSEEVRKCIVEELLLPYNKRLDPEQMQIVAKKTDSGRPLYLSITCEELRVFGEFRTLTDKIHSLSDSLGGLVDMVLQRVVENFGGDLVRATLCLIETSHFGLEEEELLHLLSAQPVIPTSLSDCTSSDFKDKLPMATWGFLYVGLRSFLRPSGSAGDGRVDFYHRTISKVVRSKYLHEKEEANRWHGRLIQFFLGSSNTARKAEELPYHYIAVNNMEGLRRCLLTRTMFEHLYREESKQTLLQYWQVAGGYQLAAESYKKALQDILSFEHLEGTAEGEKLSTKVAWFLVDIGEYDAADELLGHIIGQLTTKYGQEAVELADPLHATMTLLMRKALKYVYGSHPGYKECVKKGRSLVPLTAKVHREKFEAKSNDLGNVLSLCGYFKGDLLEECKAIFEANDNKVGLAVVLYTLGEKNQYSNDMNVPIKLFEESLALCKVYFGLYHLNTARCVQLYGQLFWNRYTENGKKENVEESLKHYTVELNILEEILGDDHPTTVRSREDVIIILQSLGHDVEANKYLAKQPQTRQGIA